MSEAAQAPTQAAVLELRHEQAVVREAYVFLDEKRLLLASELMRQLRLYRDMNRELAELHASAREAMQAAVMHHGLNGLQVYPAGSPGDAGFEQHARNFMGVTLVDAQLAIDDAADSARAAANPSAVAENCRRIFREIVVRSAALAGLSGNLHRLLAEFRLTERRARALENIILPEIEQSLREMAAHLEELDLEDAVRVRVQSG